MKRIALTLIASAVSSLACAATPLTAQQILEQFNLVTLGSATTISHVDGRSYIGGDLTGNKAVFGMHANALVASPYAALTVKGDVIGQETQVTSGGAVIGGNLTNGGINGGATYVGKNATSSWFSGNGSAYINGDATSSTFNVATYVNGAATSNSFAGGYRIGGTATGNQYNSSMLSSVPAVPTAMAAADSTNFSQTLTSLSSSLYSLQGNSGYVISEGDRMVTFTAADSKFAVFDLSKLGSTYYSGYKFKFDLGEAKTVIMNVAAQGTLDFSSSFDDFGNGYATKADMASKVIWNFSSGLTELNTDKEFRGSILATGATLTNQNNVEGVVMVNGLDQRAEIHYATAFTGTVTAVPEPETYAMMLGGLALMAGIARRRRAA